ncbi:signal recognition particle-docking protein FtsY [Plesiomonas sp.]|uniref:signal recognition particle-docking protein FtsY n=1 Tax=Plesiomonas sp. TaxID=2486279 RepID=UPI003F3729B9
MTKEKKRGFWSWLGLGRKEAEPEMPSAEAETPQADASHTETNTDITPVIDAISPSAVKPADEPVPAPEIVVELSAEPAAEIAAVEPKPVAEIVEPVLALTPEFVPTAELELEPEKEPEQKPEHLQDAELVAEPLAEHIVESAVVEPEPVAEMVEPVLALMPESVPTVELELELEKEPEQKPEHLQDAEPVAAPLAEHIAEIAAIEPEPVAEIVEPVLALAPEPVPTAELELEPEKEPKPVSELASESVSEPQPQTVVEESAEVTEVIDTADSVITETADDEEHLNDDDIQPEVQDRPTKEGFFARLKRSLLKTKQNIGTGFFSLFRGKKIDDELFEELEEQLLIADVGVNTTSKIIDKLTQHASRKQLRDAEALYGLLKEEMAEILAPVEAPLNVEGQSPYVILMVGVNGVGKTTTIGKLARQFQGEGKSVMLAAGDTFRAAAVEQLQVWGQRNKIPVIAQHTGADSASVIYDAIQAAKARKVDVLIADTAGRLQNKSHLMEELKKIVRVMKKIDENAPHEIMLTLDAGTGQNAISQAKLFQEAVGLTGITLTKLDGTAKGGVIFAIADQFSIPIRYIGVGEGIDDLRPFHAKDFIEALFAREE